MSAIVANLANDISLGAPTSAGTAAGFLASSQRGPGGFAETLAAAQAAAPAQTASAPAQNAGSATSAASATVAVANPRPRGSATPPAAVSNSNASVVANVALPTTVLLPVAVASASVEVAELPAPVSDGGSTPSSAGTGGAVTTLRELPFQNPAPDSATGQSALAGGRSTISNANSVGPAEVSPQAAPAIAEAPRAGARPSGIESALPSASAWVTQSIGLTGGTNSPQVDDSSQAGTITEPSNLPDEFGRPAAPTPAAHLSNAVPSAAASLASATSTAAPVTISAYPSPGPSSLSFESPSQAASANNNLQPTPAVEDQTGPAIAFTLASKRNAPAAPAVATAVEPTDSSKGGTANASSQGAADPVAGVVDASSTSAMDGRLSAITPPADATAAAKIDPRSSLPITAAVSAGANAGGKAQGAAPNVVSNPVSNPASNPASSSAQGPPAPPVSKVAAPSAGPTVVVKEVAPGPTPDAFPGFAWAAESELKNVSGTFLPGTSSAARFGPSGIPASSAGPLGPPPSSGPWIGMPQSTAAQSAKQSQAANANNNPGPGNGANAGNPASLGAARPEQTAHRDSDASAAAAAQPDVAQAVAVAGTAPTISPAAIAVSGAAVVVANAAAKTDPAPPAPAGNPPASAAAEAPPAAPPGPVQMAQMVNQVGQSAMRIGMTTPAFGSVEVRTTVRASDVGLLIGSEKGDLRSMMANEIPALANTLQQQNLRLNSVNFHQGFAFSNNSSGGGDGQQRSFATPRSMARHNAPEAGPENSFDATPAVIAGAGGGISILA